MVLGGGNKVEDPIPGSYGETYPSLLGDFFCLESPNMEISSIIENFSNYPTSIIKCTESQLDSLSLTTPG